MSDWAGVMISSPSLRSKSAVASSTKTDSTVSPLEIEIEARQVLRGDRLDLDARVDMVLVRCKDQVNVVMLHIVATVAQVRKERIADTGTPRLLR